MAIRIQRKSLRLVSAALFAAVLLHRGAEAAELKVCVDKSSPAARMDAGVARAVSRLQGDTAHITWFDGGGDDDDGLSPRSFRKLAGGECQLILGFPVDAKEPLLPDGVQATSPYGRTGFVLVTRGRAPSSLEHLPGNSVVAVTYMTAPNLYFSDHPRISPLVFTTDASTLRALTRGEVAAAMLWRPFAARHLHDRAKAGLSLVALAEPHAAWNLVALYAEANRPVAARFEQGIETLRQSGALQGLLEPYADALPPPASSAAAHPARWPATTGPRAHLIRVSDKKHSSPRGDKGPPPALFTEEQAEAGKLAFQKNCAMCHGPNLEGRSGPALKGLTFATPEAGFSVGDIFKILSLNMPAPAPGTLPHEDYVNIMSFLLKQNGYPSGTTALTFESAGKSKIKLVYREPESEVKATAASPGSGADRHAANAY